MAVLRSQVLWSSSPAICNAHVLPRLLGAFIYDHLGRVEQTYVAKGHLFLFIKFMASPRLHTVKTGRIGPKASCRLTASDARTLTPWELCREIRSAITQACRPATRFVLQALSTHPGVHTGREAAVAAMPGGQPSRCLVLGKVEEEDCISIAFGVQLQHPSSWREF